MASTIHAVRNGSSITLDYVLHSNSEKPIATTLATIQTQPPAPPAAAAVAGWSIDVSGNPQTDVALMPTTTPFSGTPYAAPTCSISVTSFDSTGQPIETLTAYA